MSLGRKELVGIYPKISQVEHFPDIQGVTCPKNIVIQNLFRIVVARVIIPKFLYSKNKGMEIKKLLIF